MDAAPAPDTSPPDSPHDAVGLAQDNDDEHALWPGFESALPHMWLAPPQAVL